MLAAVCPAPGQLRLQQVEEPSPGPGEVLVEVAACGICGTDLHIVDGSYHAEYPAIPGHELSGTVRALGVGVMHLPVGTRVAVNPNLPCRHCRQCRRGRPHLCENPEAVGVTRPGGFGARCAVPAELAVPLPEGLAPAEAALMEPVSCCLHGLEVAPPSPGDRVIILGAGAIGLLLLQLVRLSGATRVVVSEPVQTKRELAEALGADAAVDPSGADDLRQALVDAAGGPADLVVEAAGVPATAALAPELVGPGGTVLFFGVCDEEVRVAISPRRIFREELTIVGSYTNPFTDQRALDLLGSGRIEPEPIISDRFALEEAPLALARAREPDSVKVMLLRE
jgi:2-desacetyl-2-hydroxyethyl bacteriochlorophyllide A dehydrogenase